MCDTEALCPLFGTNKDFLNKFLDVYLFILREHAHMSREGAEREGERERIPSRLHAANEEPDVGLKLRNREIMT